ncbi:dTMP kinase [Altericista sp. CCNU0014]|uniref:dTMP kinase n=1 Tax=Altericista sp. CCNU0014 TaxID=3082949 RepID=UPI00384E84F2
MDAGKGRFIVFEGTEGVGKSTQLRRLRQWLAQRLPPGVLSIAVTREPGGTDLGQRLRALLLDSALTEAEGLPHLTELLLYAADRAQHVHTTLKPALTEGALVLCDRYTGSTIAYQGYGRGLDLALIERLNAIATGGLTPDLTLWLDLDVREGLRRARQRQPEAGELEGKDRMEAAELSFHQRVRQGFAALAAANPQQIVRIDAGLPEDRVSAQIQTAMEQHLQQWYPQHLASS